MLRYVGKEMFLDRKRVTAATDAASLRNLNRGGGMVRVTAQRSMRQRKGPSAPG